MVNDVCRSEHYLRGILHIASSDKVAYDLCPNPQCGGCFGKALHLHERRVRRGERCELCGAPRYSKLNNLIAPMRR